MLSHLPFPSSSKYLSLQEKLGKGSGTSSAQAAAFQADPDPSQADSREQQHLQLLRFSQGMQILSSVDPTKSF